MRYLIMTIGGFLLLSSCRDQNGSGNRVEVERSQGVSRVTEAIDSEKEILEIYGNDSTLFTVYKDNTFTLVTLNKEEIEGNLNYERGLGADIDATVYVLDFDKLGSERYYVRYTKSGSVLVPLDQMREKMDIAYLVKVKRQ